MTESANPSVPRARSIIGLSLIALVMVSVLVSLGVWQLHRKDEKRALIAALTERLAAAPITLPHKSQWSQLRADRDEFKRVKLTGLFQPEPEANVYSSGSALRTDISGLGTFVFAPVRLAGGDVVVVNRGFVPDGAPVKPEIFREPSVLTGYLRFPEHAGLLTPKEDAAKHLWFVRDHQAMAKASGRR